MTLDELLNRVKAVTGLTSNRQIAQRLDISPNNLSSWKRGICHPSDDTVMALCNLAGEPPEPWLIALNQWRNTGPTRQVYRNIERALNQRPFPLEAAE